MRFNTVKSIAFSARIVMNGNSGPAIDIRISSVRLHQFACHLPLGHRKSYRYHQSLFLNERSELLNHYDPIILDFIFSNKEGYTANETI